MADERLDVDKRQSLMGKIDAGMRSAANFLTFGYADKFDAYMASKTGIGGKKDAYEENLANNEVINEIDREVNHEAVVAGKVAGAAIGLSGLATRGLVSAGAKSLGQTTGATIAAPGNIARAVVSAPSTVASAVRAAPSAVVNVAKATANVARHPSIIGTAIKNGAKAVAGLAVSATVANGVLTATENLFDDGKKEDDPSKIFEVDTSKIASAGLTAATGYGLLKLGERAVEGKFRPLVRMGEKLSGSAVGRVVAGTGQAAWQGATKFAATFGAAIATGELAAAAYARDLVSDDPTLITKTIYDPLKVYTDSARKVETAKKLAQANLFEDARVVDSFGVSGRDQKIKAVGDIAVALSYFGAKTQPLEALVTRTSKINEYAELDGARKPDLVVAGVKEYLHQEKLAQAAEKAEAELAAALPQSAPVAETKVNEQFNDHATAKKHTVAKQHKAADPAKLATETTAPAVSTKQEKLPVFEITENQVTTVETPAVIEMAKLAESLKAEREEPTQLALNTAAPPKNKAELS